MPSLCVVAGDPSGDAHAARLIEALKPHLAGWTFSGLGGPAMQRAGVSLLDDLTSASAIGPFDALRHLGRFIRARRLLSAHLETQRPNLVILVDCGDFNLPIVAPLAKRFGCRVVYYISPQVWAWGRFRLRWIRRYVDHMLVLFPFEEECYRRAGVPVTWVGHPLVDLAKPCTPPQEALARYGLNPWRRTVGLLPGSRAHELARHLPLFLRTARRIAWRMPGVQFLLSCPPTTPASWFEQSLAHAAVDVHLAEGSLYDALQLMDAALVTSGTATLEAALCAVPMAVVYRTAWPTYLMARAVVRIPHIAMVNVVAQRQVVPEFLQHHATPQRLAEAIVGLLRDEARRTDMKTSLRDVTQRLGPPGGVSRAAHAVLDCL